MTAASSALTRGDRGALAAIASELDTLRLGGGSAVDTALPAISQLIGVDGMMVYNTAVHGSVRVVERWQSDMRERDTLYALASRAFAAEVIAEADASEIELPTTIRSILPAGAAPNRMIEAIAWLERGRPGTWQSSSFCRDVFAPVGIHRHKQYRALVCEGRSLLAWFGTITEETLDPRRVRILQALVPFVRRRFSLERKLEAVPHLRSALEVALDRVGTPAFLVDRAGRIREMNAVGHVLFTTRRRELVTALADAVAGRAASFTFELSPVRDAGAMLGWLALLRPADRDARIEACIDAASRAWRLTPRQRAVLALVARGLATATIADELGVSARAVEHRVTSFLDHAGVDSRAALVAAVLALV